MTMTFNKIFPVRADAPYFLSADKDEWAELLQSALSERTGIPLLKEAASGFCLHRRADGFLELYSLSNAKLKITVDFASGDFMHRLKTSGKNQPLTKAIGLSKGISNVLDATGGLGCDAMILASQGLNITLCERHPLIALLLENGLEQAGKHCEFVSRVHLKMQDASDFLNESDENPQAIYLDPMYPVKQKSSLPGKHMQILEALVGADSDQTELFHLALKKATDRVVVKRPKSAKAWGTPTHSYTGTTTRYDMYKTLAVKVA